MDGVRTSHHSQLGTAVAHRDIKPGNILYTRDTEERGKFVTEVQVPVGSDCVVAAFIEVQLHGTEIAMTVAAEAPARQWVGISRLQLPTSDGHNTLLFQIR